MASYYWIGGSGSQSFVSTANWSSSRNGAGGAGPPTNGDTAYILDGDSKIDQGLTSGAWQVLVVGFDGTIGTSGQALVNTTAGNSRLTYQGKGAYAYVGNITSLRCYGTGGGTVYISASNFGASSGIEIGPGSNVVFESDAINIGDTSTLFSGAGVTIKDASGDTCAFEASGGSIVSCARQVTTATLIGSGTVLTYTKAATATAIYAYDGAQYVHASSADVTTLTLYPRARAMDVAGGGNFAVVNVALYPRSNFFDPRFNTITTTTISRPCQP